MKKIFFLILLVISISEMTISQTITFDKSINANSATQVLQTDDGGYLLNCPARLKFIKTDQFGYIEWVKEYPEIFNPGKQISKTIDGGYVAVGFKSFTDQNICLVKLDNNLDTIWTRTYGPGSAQAVIQLPDSSFIISSLDGGKFFLRKTDAEGSLIWVKEILGLASLLPSYLANLNNGNFLFGKRSAIIKMNSEADTIWAKTVDGTNTSFLTHDGYILTSTLSSVKKLDLDGNQIWQKEFGSVRSFAQTSNGNYALVKGNFATPTSITISLMDTSGNILSQIPFENSGEYISSTDDGGFVVCGAIKQPYNFLYTWLLKTDSDLNYNALNIKQPLDGENLNLFNTYPIVWKANNVNYVNIDYSTDNQNTWNDIINYFPAEADTFNWTLPVMPSGNIFIRISDSFNPDIYDRSDPPQTAINYQAVDYITANEIFMWMGNNGMNSHDPRTDGSGFYWPGGEDATLSAIFADGLVWGGKVNGEIRVNGATYRYGLTPGYILPSGLPSDPFEVKSRIFKLKKDWQYLPPGPERDRYEFNFLNWPVDVGASWDDNDSDGIYTPGIDNPKIFGDETLFFVANDLDTLTSLSVYGSNPIGLEFQVTTFGYNTELLKDVVFKKYKVINKSPATITDMYFTYWADDDLGNANDDYEGFDSTLNMGFVFNADNDDDFYYGTPPPAVGHMLVQSPIIPSSASDSARFGNGWRRGYRNIEMTASGLMLKNYMGYGDPELGNYQGTLQFYNAMQGLKMDGSSIINPISGEPTIWPLCGDPVNGTGWYEGDGWPGGPLPADRRYHVPTGPFNMAPNDTQEVAVAIFIKKGTDNINSITELKNYAAQIQHWYDNDLVTDVEETSPSIPTEFSLLQNYPNPFNPSTKISWQSPIGSWQTLKVYDVLGNEIKTLFDEYRPAGKFEVEFKSSVGSLQLASGIYFYRLQAGSFIETKKMILLK